MNLSKLASPSVLARCLFLSAMIVGLLPVSSAQLPDQIVKWTAAPEPPRVKVGGRLTVTLTGTIENGWHTYSITQPRGGPLPTTIKLPPKQPFKLAGAITGTEPEKIFDSNFSMETEIHADRVAYTLPIAVDTKTSDGSHDLSIAVRFQACNARICLPPTTLLVKTSVKVESERQKSSIGFSAALCLLGDELVLSVDSTMKSAQAGSNESYWDVVDVAKRVVMRCLGSGL